MSAWSEMNVSNNLRFSGWWERVEAQPMFGDSQTFLCIPSDLNVGGSRPTHHELMWIVEIADILIDHIPLVH